jgi:hypothetical protein
MTSMRIKSFECTLNSSKPICKPRESPYQYKVWNSRDVHDNSRAFRRLFECPKVIDSNIFAINQSCFSSIRVALWLIINES